MPIVAKSEYTVSPLADGAKGDAGRGVVSITPEYYLSTSKTTQTGGSWVTTPPTWVSGKYLWTRSKIVYSNPSGTEYTTPSVSSEWEAVNQIQVGGRNLYVNTIGYTPNTPFVHSWTKGDAYRTVFDDKIIHCKQPFKAGDIVTIQAESDAMWSQSHGPSAANDGKLGMWFYFCATPNSSAYTTPLFLPNDLGSDKTKFVATRVLPVVSGLSEFYISMCLNGYSYPSGTEHTANLWNIKLERGNKATDWTPAPEDIDASISAAQTAADTANAMIADIGSDNKLTPVEKQEIKREFDAVTGEFQTILNEASQFDVDTTQYSAAYVDLHSYMTPLIADLTTTSSITGETLRSKFSAYYRTRQGLLGDISIANKQLTENVRDDFLESSVHKSNTPPENPPVNKLWLDISLSPEQLKRWTGTEWAIVGRSITDNYIKLGNIKMPDESTEFGIAVGKDVDVLDANGNITTINRSMSVQTAKAFKILTGGEESFAVDATGANAKDFRGESVVLTNTNKTGVWVQTTTPTLGFVLKWGG